MYIIEERQVSVIKKGESHEIYGKKISINNELSSMALFFKKNDAGSLQQWKGFFELIHWSVNSEDELHEMGMSDPDTRFDVNWQDNKATFVGSLTGAAQFLLANNFISEETLQSINEVFKKGKTTKPPATSSSQLTRFNCNKSPSQSQQIETTPLLSKAEKGVNRQKTRQKKWLIFG